MRGSANWLCLSHGCASQSITIATAYDTLGSDAVEFSLTQTEAKAMYTDPHLLKTASLALKNAKDVKYLIYNDSTNMPISDDELAKFETSHPELTIISYSDLVALGAENPVPPVPPKPTDLCCIMYTSGSSGAPKGVPITHGGLLAGVTGLYEVISETVSSKEVVLAYLPLAHILEMCVENLVVGMGGTLGYGSPRTLADTSMRHCAGDMRELAPTVMVGVPQIWETIRKGIEGRVNSGGALTRSLFWGAYNLKSVLVSMGLPGGSILDTLVFNKVRHLTGGRVRFLFNGGSGISEGTLQFMSIVLAPMVTGYGLTETCSNGVRSFPPIMNITDSEYHSLWAARCSGRPTPSALRRPLSNSSLLVSRILAIAYLRYRRKAKSSCVAPPLPRSITRTQKRRRRRSHRMGGSEQATLARLTP